MLSRGCPCELLPCPGVQTKPILTGVTKFLIVAITVTSTFTATAASSEQTLAAELANEGQFRAAAIEYRRLALTATVAAEQSGYYWGAAHSYFKSNNSDLAFK